MIDRNSDIERADDVLKPRGLVAGTRGSPVHPHAMEGR